MSIFKGLLMASNLHEEAYKAVPNHIHIFKLKADSENGPYSPLNNHPDIYAFECRQKSVVAPNLLTTNFKKELEQVISLRESEGNHVRLFLGEKSVGNRYPTTCGYNAIVFQDFLIGKFDSLDPQVIITAKKSGLEIIDVKQGYSRCNCFAVGKSSLVTSDLGIAKTVRQMTHSHKMSCHILYCPAQEIMLSGFSHGFIGGTTWELEEGRRFFNGDVTRLSIWEALKKILYEAEIEPVYLRDKPLEDVGSAVSLYI